ncbi:MarR family transcriptional regulator [Streptomyces malaysiensis subsp. malaysiensis]
MTAEGPEAGQGGDGEHDLLAMLPRLTQLSGAVNRGRLTERAMEAAGVAVDRPAMSVLVSLHVAGGPLRVGEIAARMQVVGPHVTRQVNELARRGLVRRVTDPDDQRARLIEPTAEGGGDRALYADGPRMVQRRPRRLEPAGPRGLRPPARALRRRPHRPSGLLRRR